MAGNRVEYIIDLVVKDTKLRQEMAKIDWEKIIGSKGKGMSEAFTKGTEDAANQIRNTFRGLNIDWKNILGEKDLGRLETQLGKVFSNSSKEIRAFASLNDTSGIENVIKSVVKLGGELQNLDLKFDTGGVVRFATAFMKALAPFEDKAHEVETVFSNLFGKVKNGGNNKGAIVSPFNFTNQENVMNQYQKDIESLQASLKGLSKVKISFNLEDIPKHFAKVADQVDQLIAEIEVKQTKLDSKKDSISTNEFNNQKISIAKDYAQLANLYRQINIMQERYNGAMGISLVDDQEVIKPGKQFKSAKKYVKDVIASLSQTQATSEGSYGAVGIEIALPSEQDIRNRLNSVIDQINKTKSLHKIKLNVDDQLNFIDDKKMKATKANSEEQSVPYSVSAITKGFESIQTTIGGKQDEILAKTQEWRKNMINAMKISKGDIDFNFGLGPTSTAAEALLDELNAYFADNVIDININKEKLKNDITEVLGQSGASIGGGTATIDPKTLVSAIATGLQAALTGDFTPITDKKSEKSATDQVSFDKTKRTIYLDPQDPYNTMMGKEFIELAKYAQGKGKPAASLRNFFDMKGVDLKSIADSQDVMKALDALAKVIEKGGATLESEFGELIVGRNALMSSFKTNLSELLYTQNIGQRTLSQDDIINHSINTFKDFIPKQQLVSGIASIRNLKADNLASLRSEDIESLASIASGVSDEALKSGNTVVGDYYKKIVNMLSALKTARENAGNLDDDTKQQELSDTVSQFKQDIEQTYNDLLNYVRTFDMHAYVKGRKPMRVSGGASGRSLSRVLNAINGDWTKLEDVTLQKMPNTGALGVMNKREEQRLLKGSNRLELYRPGPDRTDILNRDVSINDFKPSEITSKRWQDSTTAEAQASTRETEAQKLVEEAAKRATSLANTEAELDQQIAAKQKQLAATQKKIAKNKEKMAEIIGEDGRKISGAQTRLRNADTNVDKTSQAVAEAQKILEQAKQEREAADRALRELQKNDYSQIDAQKAQIAQYEAWMKNPSKYRKDLIGEIQIGKDGSRKLVGGIYEDDYRNAKFRLDEAQGKISTTEYKLSRRRSELNQFSGNEQSRKILESKINQLERELSEYQQEANKHQSIIDDILRKRTGATASDKKDFATDVKRKYGGYYDEYGDFHKGKLQYAQEYLDTLGKDPRDEVAARAEQARVNEEVALSALERAQSENNAALKKQKEVKQSDDYVKRAVKINELTSKNSQLEQDITRLNSEIKADTTAKDEISAKKESDTSQARLTATEELKVSIDALINGQNELEQEIVKQKAEADAIDKSVNKRMQQKAHKTPKSDIRHSKKDQQVMDKYYEHENRSQYLSKVAENSLGEKDFIPTNLTATMQKAIESIANSRQIIQSLGKNTNDTILKLGLDKFTSEADLKKEVTTRLDAGAKSETKIPAIITEYYNKILNVGQDGALQWLEKTISSSLQNIEAQKSKLTSLSQTDANKAAELQPLVDDLNAKLPQMYRERITTWVSDIQQKVSYLGTEGLSAEDSMLTTKEIEELGKITNNAFSNYNKNYVNKWNEKIQKEEKTLATLQQALKTANEVGNLDETSEIEEKIIKSQNLINEYVKARAELLFLTPEQEVLIRDAIKYSYNRELNKDVNARQNELKDNRTKTERQISERSAILETRRAELLNQIKTTPSGASTDALQKELEGINSELSKYQQYFTMLNVNTLFADDVEFANEYEAKLKEIISLTQQLDLTKAMGSPTADLIAEINTKQSTLDDSIYGKLQAKQKGLLTDIGTFAKEGRNTADLEKSLEAVNAELTKYELTKRRIAQTDITKELSLYGADEHVIKTYNEDMRETIRLEQERDKLIAKSQDPKNDQAIIDKKAELRKHNTQSSKRLKQAIEDQVYAETQGSARVQALEYLKATDEAYQTAYEKVFTAKGRIKRVEGKISDIQPDKAYWNSGLYKSHINTVKDKMVDRYIHSDQLKADRDAGYSKVQAEMKSYLEGQLGPEAAKQVLDQLTQSVAKGGEKIDPSKLMDAFVNLQRTSEEYSKYVATLQASEREQYKNKIAPYAEQRDAVVNKSLEELDLIRSASEKDYAPLREEMDKIRSRVDVTGIEKEFKQILKDASKRDKKEGLNKLKSKLTSVARSYGADKQEIDDLYNVINSNISNIRHSKDQSWISNALPRIFGMDEDRVREMARANLEKQEQAKIDKANSAYIKQDASVTKSLAARTQEAINKYLDSSVTKTVQSLLANTEGIKDTEGIVNKFNELMKTYVYDLVSDYAQGLSVGKNMPSGEEIRQEIERGLMEELEILQGNRPELKAGLSQFEGDLAHIEAQRKMAMDFGAIGRKDATDADIVKQQAEFASRITTETERQREMQSEINRLEKEGGQEERIAKLNAVIDESQEKINKWQMLINNRDNLLDMQHQIKIDEKAEKTYTPEQQRLWYTNALEAAKLNLDSEDPTKKRLAEESVTRYTDLLNKLETKMAKQQSEGQGKGGLIGQLASLLKGAGGVTLDASGLASQATLEQIAMAVERILVTLGGDVATSIVKDPEIEGKLARMHKLEEKYGGKPGQKIVEKQGEVGKKAKSTSKTPTTKFPENFDFQSALQTQADEVKKYSGDTKRYILEQAKLYQLLWAYKNNTPELKDTKVKDFYAKDDIKKLGLDENLSTSEKRKEAYKIAGGTDKVETLARDFVNKFKVPIKDTTAEANKQLENEKAKTAETQKQAEVEKQSTADGKIRYSTEDYNEYNKLKKETKGYKGGEIIRNETEGLSSGLAKDETLHKILDAINNVIKNGVTARPKAQVKKDDSAPTKQKTEADLIRDKALVNDEVVRKLSAGKAGLYDKYVKDVEDLNNAVKEANKADDKKKAIAINRVKAKADKVTTLGNNIIRDTADWEYKSAQGTVLKSFKTKKDMSQTYMENLAKQHGGVNKGKNQYKFLGFDGNTLTYQLTDIEGKVRQVTMEWNAFNKEIAITSDRSLNKFAGLAGKVDNLNTKFSEAKEMGYLHEQDKDLEAYYEQLKKIDELIKKGGSFADVDKERGKALALGDVVTAKIGKTKRMYNQSGFGKVDNQRRKIVDVFGSQEAFNESELSAVQQYRQAYLNLQSTYKNLHTERMALSEGEQEKIRQQAVGVESLGRKALRQAKEVQTLRQAVENSGSYEDKDGNEILLGGTKSGFSKTEVEVNNLKNTMIDFAKNGLGHADMENVKFNKTTQTLTYNQRINKDTVAEQAIQYKQATNTMYAYNKAEKESLTGWKGFMKDMKSKSRSIFSYLAYTTSIYRIISVVRQGITYVKEIDLAMTELRKVTDETSESYERFLGTASKVAKKVGSTTKEVISSTADWARLNI